jgi:hypothetical protein
MNQIKIISVKRHCTLLEINKFLKKRVLHTKLGNDTCIFLRQQVPWTMVKKTAPNFPLCITVLTSVPLCCVNWQEVIGNNED